MAEAIGAFLYHQSSIRSGAFAHHQIEADILDMLAARLAAIDPLQRQLGGAQADMRRI